MISFLGGRTPWMRCGFFLLSLVLAGACASPQPRQTLLHMPALHLRIDSQGGLDAYDQQSSFEAGNKSFDAGLWREAVLQYQRAVREFKESELTYPAAFNAGLALEKLRMYPEAISYFTLVEAARPAMAEAAQWHLVELYLRTEDWQAALASAERLMPAVENQGWQAELRTIADLLQLYRAEEASNTIAERVDQYRAALRREDVSSKVPMYLGWYLAGLREADQIAAEGFADLAIQEGQSVLEGPLGTQLEASAQHLLDAQAHFLRAIRHSDVEWASSSVFRIGQMYENFYRGLVQIQFPSALADADKRLYAEELQREIAPVKEKAEIAYERLVRFARTNPEAASWLDKAREQLQHIQSFDPWATWQQRL